MSSQGISLCPCSSHTFGIQLQNFVWRSSCSSTRCFVCASLGFSSPRIFSLTVRAVGSTDLRRPSAGLAQSQSVNHPDCGRSVRLDDHTSNQIKNTQKALMIAANSDSPLLTARTPNVLDHAFTNMPLSRKPQCSCCPVRSVGICIPSLDA